MVENAIRSLNLTVCPDDVANEEIEWLGVKVLIGNETGIKLLSKHHPHALYSFTVARPPRSVLSSKFPLAPHRSFQERLQTLPR